MNGVAPSCACAAFLSGQPLGRHWGASPDVSKLLDRMNDTEASPYHYVVGDPGICNGDAMQDDPMIESANLACAVVGSMRCLMLCDTRGVRP